VPESHVHRMPFGAEVVEDGVRFRLWAPAAKRVQLVLEAGADAVNIDMGGPADGWFELVTAAARPGSLYRYRIDGGLEVADPASRFNPRDVRGGPSMVIDPQAFAWTDAAWRGRSWHEAVVYELHTGAFSRTGDFRGIEERLGHLAALGVTVIELMPIADFPGRFGWGYDGVLLFAPDSSYGTPEELKAFIAAAHRHGLAVMLDVVYNHFGPEGNYLHAYAPQFFNPHHQTPWGAAINFDGAGSSTVRSFFVHNALFWLGEYRFDGLRFDAVHAIHDDSVRHIMDEIAVAVRDGPGRDREIHLVLENAGNQARYLAPPGTHGKFDAQWNDDTHHCLHAILTGEHDGYYADYAAQAHRLLARCLAEGFAFQGERSAYRGNQRGEPSAHLPPTAFVNFLQNHDQIGNREFGERIGQLVSDESALRAAVAVVLLAPSPPLLFMGEEWCAPQPFPYFCDFESELAARVRAGRREEFARFVRFQDGSHGPPPTGRTQAPDPCAEATFASARLDWGILADVPHAMWLDYFRQLLAVRRRDIVPLIPQVASGRSSAQAKPGRLAVEWTLRDRSSLHLVANLSGERAPAVPRAAGRVLFSTHPAAQAASSGREELPPWCVTWLLEHRR
jgi:maltooligosyltrehalose trehalohydrolase